jgi:hypothetical protein
MLNQERTALASIAGGAGWQPGCHNAGALPSETLPVTMDRRAQRTQRRIMIPRRASSAAAGVPADTVDPPLMGSGRAVAGASVHWTTTDGHLSTVRGTTDVDGLHAARGFLAPRRGPRLPQLPLPGWPGQLASMPMASQTSSSASGSTGPGERPTTSATLLILDRQLPSIRYGPFEAVLFASFDSGTLLVASTSASRYRIRYPPAGMLS